jgi:hypothetical protein
MVTGSTASGLHGEPRSTHDIDIVVELAGSHVQGLVLSFPEPDYYLEELTIRDALNRRGHFNLIDTTSGDKVLACRGEEPPALGRSPSVTSSLQWHRPLQTCSGGQLPAPAVRSSNSLRRSTLVCLPSLSRYWLLALTAWLGLGAKFVP